jgi:signal transduction histidine kinase
VAGDRTRLRQVYQNLIHNALTFTAEGTKPVIEVGARARDGDVECFVEDNGIGIEAEDHDRVFGLFERLDARTEGSGLGLAIVKRVIEAHGGRIWVESEGRGKGATFRFTLPGTQRA